MDLSAIIDVAKGGLAWICLCVLSLIAAAYALAGLRGAWRTLRARLNPFAVCAFAVVSAFATVEAQKRASGGASRTTRPARESARPRASVTQEEIERGWRFVAETDCEAGVYAMPDGVSPSFNWHKRGTFGEWARLDLGNFAFPLGADGGEFTSFSVFNDGRIRPTPRDAAHEIRAVGVPMLAMQGASRFWTASGADGSKLLTWENFFLHADTNAPINAQIELFANGDFTTRSNNVERIFCRIEPFDWDGDGLENTVDPDPLVAGPDAHGTNDEWYDAVCSGVANSNAYYFVDVVAERGPAPVFFTGDRESRFGDPVVVALAGETNRVPLLMGVEYAVTSSVPLDVWAEDGHAAIVTNNDHNYTVSWPLSFGVAASQGGGYSIDVQPFDPGGGFSWNMAVQGGGAFMTRSVRSTPGCAYNSASNWIGFTCGSLGDCGCHGCSVDGIYVLEDAVFAATRVFCECAVEANIVTQEVASLSVSFDRPAVIFERQYENAPGEWIAGRSTEVSLRICASGGTNGVTVALSYSNIGKLLPKDGPIALPPGVTLPPRATYFASFTFTGKDESGAEDDIRAEGTLVENETGERIESGGAMTAVRVELRPEKLAPENSCVNRHIYGIDETVYCLQQPSAPQVQWSASGSGVVSNLLPVCYMCPVNAEHGGLFARIGSIELQPLINVVEPDEVVCTAVGFLPSDNLLGIGMALELRIRPFTVSFEGLKVQEVAAPSTATSPEWGVHEGYFADRAYQLRWYHYSVWGGGMWVSVLPGNQLGQYDQSRMFHWPEPWNTGRMTWAIPLAWKGRRSAGDSPDGQFARRYSSEWEMSGDFVIKTKHGQELTLTEGGLVFLNGERYDPR